MPETTRDKQEDTVQDDQSINNMMACARPAPDTKKSYRFKVRDNLRTTGTTGNHLVERVKKNPNAFEKEFAEFLQQVGEKSSPSTVVGYRDAVKKFLEINRVGEVCRLGATSTSSCPSTSGSAKTWHPPSRGWKNLGKRMKYDCQSGQFDPRVCALTFPRLWSSKGPSAI